MSTHRYPPHWRKSLRPLAAAALGALALSGCGGESEARESDPTVVTVGAENVVVIRMDTLETGPLVSGSLRPVRDASVRAQAGGRVLRLLADNGETVRRGQLLARIEDAGARDTYLSAQSALRSAENNLQVARRDAERSAALEEAGALAERDVEVSRRSLATAEAQVADARARLAQAAKQLENTEVRAPFAGVVSARPVNEGDVVQPGAALFTVVDPSAMELEAAVPADQVGALRVGAPVAFRVNGYADRTFTGRIARINPAADAVTRQIPIYVSIPNSEGRLVAGLFAEGRVLAESHEALVAPLSAVDRTGGLPSAVRVKGGRVERVTVTLGTIDPETERVEIEEGLAAGDTLLTGAALGITPGTAVAIPASPRPE